MRQLHNRPSLNLVGKSWQQREQEQLLLSFQQQSFVHDKQSAGKHALVSSSFEKQSVVVELQAELAELDGTDLVATDSSFLSNTT